MVKPQQLQRFEDGKNRSIATTERPAHSPLYWSCRVNSLQPASAIALDSDGLRIMFFTLRDSTQTTWFSLISLRVALCKASVRQSAIFAWSRATFKRALARFFEPLVPFSVPLIVRWPGRNQFFPAVRSTRQCASEGLNCRQNARTRTFEPKAQPDRLLDRIEIYMRVSWFHKIRANM